MTMTYAHTPVMCEEILTQFEPALSVPDAVMVDATLGLGGHTKAALERFPGLTVIGIDRDPQAIEAATKNLGELAPRLEVHQANYDQLSVILGARRVQGVLCDLGLSSLQIDSFPRGFSYSVDAPLSMRMDGDDSQLTAADVVNTYSFEELTRILRVYGDERYASRIARALIAEREREPFTTSGRLVEVISAAIPARDTRSGHPAKRSFQALRMEVNHERESLKTAIPAALDCLAVNGRMAVLSYHSGEDRLVKQVFAQACSDKVPPGMPIVPANYRARFALVVHGAMKPTNQEMETNPRSHSARLRVITRIEEES